MDQNPRAAAPPAVADSPQILSVGQLGRLLRGQLERATVGLSVEGEVANVKPAESGHTYFTLRDEREQAAVDCVMYRSAAVRARRLLVDGARLVLEGHVTFWTPRGRVQLVAETARPAGKGALLEALEKRRAALAAEGLFALDRKRPLPRDPRVIGIVTSAQGAALHDVLKVAFARGGVRFVLATAPVQGAGAAEAMCRALRLLCKHPTIEAILLARGGGSTDDLAAFNEEVLVRAVAACRVPVVSAIGHEVDVTLTDLVADVRAATPSQAAELLVPDARVRRQHLSHLKQRLGRATRRLFDERQQRIDVLASELEAEARRGLALRRERTARLDRRLSARHPSTVLAQSRAVVAPLGQRLFGAMRRILASRRDELDVRRVMQDKLRARLSSDQVRLATLAATLDSLSPLAVLGRGYAIVQRATDRAIVRRSSDVRTGDPIDVRLGTGSLRATVDRTSADDAPVERVKADR